MQTKVCSSCQKDLPLSSYNWINESQNKRHSRCRECASIYARDYYAGGEKVKQKKRVKKYRKDLIARFKEWKSSQECSICGENCIECLDFHHLDPNEKDANISLLMRDGSWKKMQEELKKCVVLCANCHRKVHAGKFTLVARKDRRPSSKRN